MTAPVRTLYIGQPFRKSTWNGSLKSRFTPLLCQFGPAGLDSTSVSWRPIILTNKGLYIFQKLVVTTRRDQTATQPIAQQDHSALGVAAPWWLHAW